MKKILFLICTLLALTSTWAQTDMLSAKADSMSMAIVDRYLGILNYEGLRKDSMLYVVTYIIDRDYPQDTLFLYRWHMYPHYDRVEIYDKKSIKLGVYSDGKEYYQTFDEKRRTWRHVTPMTCYNMLMPYDIRGSLADWRAKGAEMTYKDETTLNGNAVEQVFVSTPEQFDRTYFFEKKSGLLFLFTEDSNMFGAEKHTRNTYPVDWRGWHEFIPFGRCLFPKIESYQADNHITILYHHYRYEPFDEKLFKENYHQIKR